MNIAYTPGPWHAFPVAARTDEYAFHVVADDENDDSLFVRVLGAPVSTKANADLVAAAPELLEALETACQYLDFHALAKAKRAIAKARGDRANGAF